MGLSRSLIKSFVKATNDSSDNHTSTSIRGTAVVTDNKKYVRLDSSEQLTPISEATDVQNGDRVLVTIEDHVATVIGNYTCPASSRTASNYLKHTDEGLLLGELDEDGSPKGMSSLMAPGIYYVVDVDGNRLASFSSDEIRLGALEAVVRFCGGKCRIYSSDGVMVLYATSAVGTRSSFTDANGDVYRAEVVCQAKDTDPVVSIQAYKSGESNPPHISVSREGIGLNGPVCSYNGYEILRTNKLLASGTITATGNIAANSNATITTNVTIPSGYHLAGIREIKCGSPRCALVSFYTHPSTNTVGANFRNVTNVSMENVVITIEWFALYTKGATYVGEDIITFGDDDTDGEEEGGEA